MSVVSSAYPMPEAFVNHSVIKNAPLKNGGTSDCEVGTSISSEGGEYRICFDVQMHSLKTGEKEYIQLVAYKGGEIFCNSRTDASANFVYNKYSGWNIDLYKKMQSIYLDAKAGAVDPVPRRPGGTIANDEGGPLTQENARKVHAAMMRFIPKLMFQKTLKNYPTFAIPDTDQGTIHRLPLTKVELVTGESFSYEKKGHVGIKKVAVEKYSDGALTFRITKEVGFAGVKQVQELHVCSDNLVLAKDETFEVERGLPAKAEDKHQLPSRSDYGMTKNENVAFGLRDVHRALEGGKFDAQHAAKVEEMMVLAFKQVPMMSDMRREGPSR